MVKDFKSALKGSLKAEEKSVEDKFKKADAFFQPGAGTDRVGVVVAETPHVVEQPVHLPAKLPIEHERVRKATFSLPLDDFDLVTKLQDKCLTIGKYMEKSEIIRAGLHALEKMDAEQYAEIIGTVRKVKEGRPVTVS